MCCRARERSRGGRRRRRWRCCSARPRRRAACSRSATTSWRWRICAASLVHAVGESQNHGGTYLAGALEGLKNICQPHRLIVVTDEQAHDGITPAWAAHSYLVNVAPYKPSLDTTQGWMRISGWSERLVDWIKAEESESLGR